MARTDADFLNPDPTTLVRIGSALVHAEEFLSPGGHPLDRDAFNAMMNDPEVKAWIASGNAMALLPVKRG